MIDAGDSVKGQCAYENSISYRLRKQSTRCQRIESMREGRYDRDWATVLVRLNPRTISGRDRCGLPQIREFTIEEKCGRECLLWDGRCKFEMIDDDLKCIRALMTKYWQGKKQMIAEASSESKILKAGAVPSTSWVRESRMQRKTSKESPESSNI
jgi:hypothetical protein